MSTLRIDTLGTLFFIESEADSEYLENLLVNYKNMVTLVEKSSAGTVTEPLQVAILSGIMLCDELFKEKQKNGAAGKRFAESR
ncbi:MAG: hypothetical protein Ta2A_20800 [Treponemataceae bacterium]|nr:MAG: hypothetical protein Ta2A_20800 [Treponemataceae bacterium]